jgi:hypothetical protein
MSDTVTGTDAQFNFFSVTPGGSGIGSGGPNPMPLPAGTWPKEQIFDPSFAYTDLTVAPNPTSPASYDSILKIADGAAVSAENIEVAQGHEDALNIQNQSGPVSLRGNFGYGRAPGLRIIAIKGGCHDIVLQGTIYQRGTRTDVEIGDWSDQSIAPSVNIDASGLIAFDGKPVRVVIARGRKVKLGANKRDWLLSLETLAYWWFKRAVRAVLRIPVGTSGPSWLS